MIFAFLDKSYLVIMNTFLFNFAVGFGRFAISFEIRKCKSSNIFFLFMIILAIQSPLTFHMNDFSIFATQKKVIVILLGIALNWISLWFL